MTSLPEKLPSKPVKATKTRVHNPISLYFPPTQCSTNIPINSTNIDKNKNNSSSVSKISASNNKSTYKQTTISQMFSKAPFTPITMHAPNEPSHPAKPAPYNSHLHPTPVSLTTFFSSELSSSLPHSSPSSTSLTLHSPSLCLPIRHSTHSRQTLIRDFFHVVPKPENSRKANTSLRHHMPPSSSTKWNQRRNKMKYSIGTQPLITSFTKSPPTHFTNAIWGHSLEGITTSSCFRLFLQNPNGLSISSARECLLQDFLTCHSYGTAALSLPETNTNWDLPNIRSQFDAMLCRVWPLWSLCHSKGPEIFNSSYQPGGTATILCDNWISCIISKGEDTLGLGRWSYMTLCGKGSSLITLVTDYCPSTAPGETTNYRQQRRTLANIFHHQNLLMSTNPTRQFFLDLQSWLEHLIAQDIILCLDANSTYDTAAIDGCWQENSKNTAMKSIIDYGEENASCNLSYRYSLCLMGSLNKIIT